MRRWLLLVLVGALALTPAAEAQHGRARGRHGQPSPVPPPNFIEDLSVVTLASDGYLWCSGPGGAYPFSNAGPAASSTAYFHAYMDNTNGCTGGTTHNIRVVKYDYTTGGRSSANVDNFGSSGYHRHDGPSIFRNPSDGLLWVFFQPILSGCIGNAPNYKVSNNPDDITGWGTRQSVPWAGGFSEITGGFDSAGTLHLFGQQQCNDGGHTSFSLPYVRRKSDGTWQGVELVHINFSDVHGTQGQRGDPGCFPSARVYPGTTIIDLVFARTTDGCDSAAKGLFFLRSTDGGDNWCNAAGTTCFTRTGTLSGTWDGVSLYDYPSAYAVVASSQTTNRGWAPARFADGKPVVLIGRSSSWQTSRWDGSAWTTPVAIATISGSENKTNTLVVRSDDTMLVYGAADTVTLKEYKSTDKGATWDAGTTLRSPGAESFNVLHEGRIFADLGGKQRVLHAWIQIFSPDTKTTLMLMDLPQ